MRVLILGGSGFVGRAVADEAVRRGDDVTVFNRGTKALPYGVRALTGDRLGDLGVLRTGTWDTVVDTWSARGDAVRRTAELLSGRAGHYAYVSSRSVYAGTGHGKAEQAPLVGPDDDGYAGDKLRGELGAAVFDGPVLLARAGLILGPYEDVGRLPWWLNRLARGGPTLAPGPRDLGLQYIDARDLAVFLLDTAARRVAGAFDLVSRPGHTTMGELLDIGNEVTGGRALLRWVDPAVIEAAGIEPWTQLPIYLPPGDLHTFLHQGDVSKAYGEGLVCRPVRETVEDTWAWLRGLPEGAPQRADRPRVGLDPQIEQKVLAGDFGA
ncbi:reductase [Paractinoplanes brasiliensis]|uniref:Nucleoside-diphosphate-sugar epimerase n=1 Tax=Paractinoplanes brasiliensis TaxID=52695 RepID=A0A4V3C616_9ACTN|nr:reductase [Actinoplanes brasiliensis]TDO31998.1 nucleoside-diphosphate-sugar epimerase [Actinoplanes brasiliensis]GID28043.1 reductase [Actinoplanes brasiliensis]